MSRKRTTVCHVSGCPELRPCSVDGHERKPWAGSTRRRTLPHDWNRRRRRILRRDPICRACRAAPSVEVDHIDDPDDHSDGNLQGLCPPCHAAKTTQQATEARRRAHG